MAYQPYLFCQLTALQLKRCPEQQCSTEKPTPIIIYNLVLFTTLKEQFTFTTQLNNHTNTATFKAVALSCWLALVYICSTISLTCDFNETISVVIMSHTILVSIPKYSWINKFLRSIISRHCISE